MPSSRNSPGPHDRRPGNERKRCIYMRANGKTCQRYSTIRATNMCKFHHEVMTEGRDPQANSPVPMPTDVAQSGLSTRTRHQHQAISRFVLDQRARRALANLRNPSASDPNADPRLVLLDSVNSAWRQRQIWEGMLASVPDEDYAQLGQPPVPGSIESSRGARIETIQRMLSEATKVAARTSKLAIDAGIEERLVRLAEEQAALIADTVRAGLLASLAVLVRELHLSPAAEAKATEAALSTAAGHLRILASGGNDAERAELIMEGVAKVVK